MQLQVTTTVTAPIEVVWAHLVDWEGQSDWMMDAQSVEVVTPQRAGVGVTIHVPTLLLGVSVLDVMRITGWEPPSRLEATHLGKVIKGTGVFDLVARAHGVTDVVWTEEIVAPFGVVGHRAAWVALPLLRAVFRRSLRRFKAVVEAGTTTTAASGASS